MVVIRDGLGECSDSRWLSMSLLEDGSADWDEKKEWEFITSFDSIREQQEDEDEDSFSSIII